MNFTSFSLRNPFVWFAFILPPFALLIFSYQDFLTAHLNKRHVRFEEQRALVEELVKIGPPVGLNASQSATWLKLAKHPFEINGDERKSRGWYLGQDRSIAIFAGLSDRMRQQDGLSVVIGLRSKEDPKKIVPVFHIYQFFINKDRAFLFDVPAVDLFSRRVPFERYPDDNWVILPQGGQRYDELRDGLFGSIVNDLSMYGQ